MNHEPSSPTPWRIEDGCLLDANRKFVVEVDFPCIVHRVNAYPKLEKFLTVVKEYAEKKWRFEMQDYEDALETCELKDLGELP